MFRVCHTADRQSRLRQPTPEEETTRAVQQTLGLAVLEHPKMKSLLHGSTPVNVTRLRRRPSSRQLLPNMDDSTASPQAAGTPNNPIPCNMVVPGAPLRVNRSSCQRLVQLPIFPLLRNFNTSVELVKDAYLIKHVPFFFEKTKSMRERRDDQQPQPQSSQLARHSLHEGLRNQQLRTVLDFSTEVADDERNTPSPIV